LIDREALASGGGQTSPEAPSASDVRSPIQNLKQAIGRSQILRPSKKRYKQAASVVGHALDELIADGPVKRFVRQPSTSAVSYNSWPAYQNLDAQISGVISI
jgi:hypothetical protein